MRYVLFSKGQVVHATTESPFTGTPKLKEIKRADGSIVTYDKAKTDPDFKSFHEVELIAEQLTEIMGVKYLAYDNGAGTSHRYGVMVPPKVGDDVSYGFNGDYYPCGKIVRITPGWRIYTEEQVVDPTTKLIDTSTEEGKALAEAAQARRDADPKRERKIKMFNRRKNTSGWKMKGGTWSLVMGIVDERNPHI